MKLESFWGRFVAKSADRALTKPQRDFLIRGLDLVGDIDGPGVRLLGLSVGSPNRKWEQLDQTVETLQGIFESRAKCFPFHLLTDEQRAVLGASYVSSDWAEDQLSIVSVLPPIKRNMGLGRIQHQIKSLERKLKFHGIAIPENGYEHRFNRSLHPLGQDHSP